MKMIQASTDWIGVLVVIGVAIFRIIQSMQKTTPNLPPRKRQEPVSQPTPPQRPAPQWQKPVPVVTRGKTAPLPLASPAPAPDLIRPDDLLVRGSELFETPVDREAITTRVERDPFAEAVAIRTLRPSLASLSEEKESRTTSWAGTLREELKDPQELKRLWVMREVLGPPRGLEPFEV